MKIAAYILTPLLLLPIADSIYIEYIYMNDNLMSREMVFIDEMKVLAYFIGCCLLLAYAVFLIIRKKYLENVVLIAGFVIFTAVDFAISNYTKKERFAIEHQLLDHHN